MHMRLYKHAKEACQPVIRPNPTRESRAGSLCSNQHTLCVLLFHLQLFRLADSVRAVTSQHNTQPMQISGTHLMAKMASASGRQGLSTILQTRDDPLPLRRYSRVVDACAMMFPPLRKMLARVSLLGRNKLTWAFSRRLRQKDRHRPERRLDS